MNIRNLLFGSKKFVETTKLGTFKARIKNEKTTKSITWLSSFNIANYSDDITIILEGDVFGPEKKQIESATWIVDNILVINKELITEINRDPKLYEKYRKHNLEDLRLSCLNPWEISLDSYDLSFESITKDEFSVSVTIQDKKIIEIS